LFAEVTNTAHVYKDSNIDVDGAIDEFRSNITEFIKMQEVGEVGGLTGVCNGVDLSEEVQKKRDEARDELRKLASNEKSDYNIAIEACNRVAEIAVRVGYLLQCYDSGIKPILDIEHYERGLVIARYSLEQHVSGLQRYSGSEVERNAAKILRHMDKWIKNNKQPEQDFKRSELQANCVKKSSPLEKALAYLEGNDEIKLSDSDPKSRKYIRMPSTNQ
jgi:hypothetical protein